MNQPITDLPLDLRPETLEEAYFVQDRMSLAYEAIGGWKVGAPSADATPLFAPMPLAWISGNGSELRGRMHRYRGIEAEIAFRLGEDLPKKKTAYSREEVLRAIESCHPAIEVLETAFVDPTQATRLSMIADLQMHGGFIYGPPCADWKSIDFTQEHVTLAIDGAVRVERTGSNTAGDLLRLLPFLANEGAERTGGLKRGAWITTGSWTGNTPASAGSAVDAQFSTAGRVTMRFGQEGHWLPD
ncbi:MAG TPA: 2-keto-4-pentenoate hydratase [Edaphobacter sp.]|nr:2-keto-4-pentenoate hydratase [Edaphobacter sp.]